MSNIQNEKKRLGIPINAVTVPVIIMLAVLHITIVVVILMVNNVSASLSGIMSDTSLYLTDVTSLQAGSSASSETSTAFILTPMLEDGTLNLGPLMGYMNELSMPRRADDVLKLFEDRVINPEAREYLNVAADAARTMFETQIHAMSLVRSVYSLPEGPQFAALPEVPLTEEEKAMPERARLGLASRLIIGQDYTRLKQVVSQNVTSCVDVIRNEAYGEAAVTGGRLAKLRTLLWIVTISIVVLLTCFFVLLYRQLVFPLNTFTRLIQSNDSLNEGRGLREVRVLASAYNALLKRRDALDAILRSAAETDALTNLPNRYRFEQYLLESAESGYSMAVFLFDINYLKQTNDTLGHLAGDKLIRDAADCIFACFGNSPEGCCFRFGGDEFAAILKNCDPQMIRERIKRFEAMGQEKNVSISLGYAYTPDVGQTTFKKLLEDADRQMYSQKNQAHLEHDRTQG